jgi:cytochrome c-type biogenesis protein CcmH
MTHRRDFVRSLAAGLTGIAAFRVSALAQQPRAGMHEGGAIRADTSNLFAMDQSAAKPVRLPPKPNAVPLLDDDQRDDLEHRIHCQCGCTLDVYTCRTTDFACRVSPAMHRDVMELVRGGYSAQEIIDAFVGVYGETARMAPKKSGFNLVAWFTPGLAVLGGGAVLATFLRRWRARSQLRRGPVLADPRLDATPAEIAKLEAAVRGDD